MLTNITSKVDSNTGLARSDQIVAHVHYHMLPRWLGDTNFIASLGGTRVYPANFDEIFEKLKTNAPKYFV